MSTIHTKLATATAAVKSALETTSFTLDPIIVHDTMKEVVTKLGKGRCKKKSRQAAETMRNPNALERLALRHECYSRMSDPVQAEVLYASILDQGEKITDDEVDAMYKEAGIS